VGDHGCVKVAAYQAPLLGGGSMGALDLIRARVLACEAEGIEVLCCPEAILGGLADQVEDPARIAIAVHTGQLDAVLAPLASDVTTTIVGFTELGEDGFLYNAAAVFHRGAVAGVYRKIHPAIHQSVYRAGCQVPLFRVGALTFGIAICNDSNFPELAKEMASRGATALFIPSNNALPPRKGGADLVTEARRVDLATAIANGMWVIRADVAGHAGDLASHGSSAIVDPMRTVVQSARALNEDLIATAIDVTSRMVDTPPQSPGRPTY
jgi:5-aminopentanamidase